MTCGIYLLRFNNTNRVYIGKSKNIEYRYTGHIWKTKRQEAPIKLQEAFNTYGIPSLEILVECTEQELDSNEKDLIKKYDTITNGFNNSTGGDGGPCMDGLNNSNSIYKEEDLFNVLYFLSEPIYSITEIAELTGVSKRAIENIASLKSHTWMRDKWPELYKKIEALKTLNRHSVNLSMNRKNNKIISPEGVEYEVLSVRAFAKEHNLLDSSVSSVLSGTRKTHKGWHLSTYTAPPEYYPEIISPDNIMYKVKFNGATKFAREHNLDPSALRLVMYGKANHHKGWKLATKL